jgi:hypothetical protein
LLRRGASAESAEGLRPCLRRGFSSRGPRFDVEESNETAEQSVLEATTGFRSCCCWTRLARRASSRVLGPSSMSLYERFKDEAEFREKFVKPLLNRLGYYGVSEQHGTQEFGKDFVFSELHRLGGMRHYASQVKHEESINQGASINGLLSQVKQAFAKPFKRADSPRECYVSAVYVFNSGKITDGAKEQLLRELERERYGDNVHFLDGDRLDALNEWATLQSDANARARLLGLRSALRFIIDVLKEYQQQGKVGLQPLFIQGIEMYLSEPVICDDQFIKALFVLWGQLQLLEAMRKILSKYPGDLVGQEKNAPKIKEVVQNGLPLAVTLCQEVELAIEKMKPLGGS